jgi:class 3 adenylate cyclase/pimeloyl-ACP methyl ester carboxylesterase
MVSEVPQTRWAKTVDGASIAYQDFGSGPVTMVVILGWISHLEIYWEQPGYARFMRRLARNMRVLTFDKRGVGMSDRTLASDLETRMDDVRAVMDAAGVERAALLAGGSGGPCLAAFFAASRPERVLALIVYGLFCCRRSPDYPYGWTPEDYEADTRNNTAHWGDPSYAAEFVRSNVFGDRPVDAPLDDPAFLAWFTRMARFSATPATVAEFDRVTYETDVRDILSSVHVPAASLQATGWEEEVRALAVYNAGLIAGAKVVEFAGAANVNWLEDPEPFVAAVEGFLASVRREQEDLDRMLATVLFTDVVGSTKRAAELGDERWKELLGRHCTTVRALLARYRGTEVKTMGDGFLATFDGPARAVRCAQGICEAVKPLGLEVRAGCHTGEIELMGTDVGGIAVHIGARVGALAGAGEVLVSSTVKDLVAGSGLTFEDRGEHELKGVPGSWRLYAVEPATA